MTIDEKKTACTKFFDILADLMKEEYEVVASCNADFSRYLVPKGTADQITYSGKPDKSFRISDHWNWFANLNKCSDPNYIQCLSVDLPWARKRIEDGKASKSITGVQVSVIGDDGKYHVVFGEKFDRKTKAWSWVDASANDISKKFLEVPVYEN